MAGGLGPLVWLGPESATVLSSHLPRETSYVCVYLYVGVYMYVHV